MAVTIAGAVRLDFDDYVLYTETHPDDSFELIDGVIYRLAPEGDPHFLTRSAIQLHLSQVLDLARFAPYTEGSFPAPGWADGPRPDNFVSRRPLLVEGQITARPGSSDIALVIEVSSTSRPKDQKRAELYGRLIIPEYWLVDLRTAKVVAYSRPADGTYKKSQTLLRGEMLESTAVDGLRVAVDFLLQLATK